MELTVNGVRYDVLSPPLTTLLNVLREELLVTSPPGGWGGGGGGAGPAPGAARPRRACLLPIAALEGAEITTVEGLSDGEELSPVQAAFHEHYAAQCGFCTAGFVMAAEALVADGATDRDEIIEGLSGHVCRCTGYAKIIEAVGAATRGEVGGGEDPASPDPTDEGVVVKGSPA